MAWLDDESQESVFEKNQQNGPAEENLILKISNQMERKIKEIEFIYKI